MADHHHRSDQHQHQPGTSEAAMAGLLDLDAEVLQSHLSDVTAWLQSQAAGLLPRRILDLGSGTGTGTFALLQRFEDTDVMAVDMSAYLLDRLRGKARVLGLDGRVRTIQADLDAEWPDIGPVDLVWASSSLHHLADADRVLTQVFGALRPGGLMAVLEMDSFPRFLSDPDGYVHVILLCQGPSGRVRGLPAAESHKACRSSFRSAGYSCKWVGGPLDTRSFGQNGICGLRTHSPCRWPVSARCGARRTRRRWPRLAR